MFSSFFRAKESEDSTAGKNGFFTKVIKLALVALKTATAGAQAFFWFN
ncbi:MAG: hypothetical protein JO131_05445 [Gammaproteobacteria bacterium]|nr:hypothetical protein [Gammaproteobacteria bacterium]